MKLFLSIFILSMFSIPAFSGTIHDLVRSGNVKAVQEYLSQNPQALWELDEEGLSVFYIVTEQMNNPEMKNVLSQAESQANVRQDPEVCPLCLSSISIFEWSDISLCCVTPMHSSCRDRCLEQQIVETGMKCPNCVTDERDVFLTDEQYDHAIVLADANHMAFEFYLHFLFVQGRSSDIGQTVEDLYTQFVRRNNNNNGHIENPLVHNAPVIQINDNAPIVQNLHHVGGYCPSGQCAIVTGIVAVLITVVMGASFGI